MAKKYIADNFVKISGTSSQYLMADGSVTVASGGGGTGIGGSGTENYLPRWSTVTALTNSQIFDNGSNVLINTVTDNGYRLNVNGNGYFTNQIETGGMVRIKGTISNASASNITLFQETTSVSVISAFGNNPSTKGELILRQYSSDGIPYNALDIKPNGNILIGTTTDNGVDKFQVNGSTSLGALTSTTITSNAHIINSTTGNASYIQLRAGGTNVGIIGSDAAITGGLSGDVGTYMYGIGSYFISTFGSKRLIVRDNGRILMGTTTDNGVDNLQVQGSIVANSIKKSGGTSAQYLMADGSVSTLSSISGVTGSGATNYIPRFTSSGTVTNSNLYNITPNYVGLGTINPRQVVGYSNITLEGNIGGSLHFRTSGATEIGGIVADQTALGFRTTSAVMPMTWQLNSIEKMRLSTSGNLLINTTNDNGFKLRVNGNVYSDATYVAVGGFQGTNVSVSNGIEYGQSIDQNGTDFNSLVNGGVYQLDSGSSNSPGVAGEYLLQVENNVFGNAYQKATNLNTNRVFVRSLFVSSWSNWSELTATGSNVTGSGVATYHTMWSSPSLVTNSGLMFETNSKLFVGGSGTFQAAGLYNVFTASALGSTIGNFKMLHSIGGNGGGNDMRINEIMSRRANGSDWTTAIFHNGIQVDNVYTSTTTTRTFWERDPLNQIQYFGSTNNKTLTIDSINGGIGVATTNLVSGAKITANGDISTTTTGKIGFTTSDKFTYDGADIAHYGMSFGPSTGIGNGQVNTSGFFGQRWFTGGVERMRMNQSGTLTMGYAGEFAITHLNIMTNNSVNGGVYVRDNSSTGFCYTAEINNNTIGYLATLSVDAAPTSVAFKVDTGVNPKGRPFVYRVQTTEKFSIGTGGTVTAEDYLLNGGGSLQKIIHKGAGGTGSFGLGTSPIIVYTVTIPPNTFESSDVMNLSLKCRKVGTGNNYTWRLYVNNSVSTSGAALLYDSGSVAAASVYQKITRSLTIDGTNILQHCTNTQLTDIGVTSSSVISKAFNPASTNYLIVTAFNIGAATDGFEFLEFVVTN